MKHPRLLATLVFTLPALAQAHPGHDDPDFAWNLDHLTAAPVATTGCLLFLAGCVWLVRSLARSSTAKAQAVKARIHDLAKDRSI
jgi:hypothetical protein